MSWNTISDREAMRKKQQVRALNSRVSAECQLMIF